ncbi:MAG: SBBP repeat-containing protein [Bryobacteraceae bacterium]
MRFYSVIILLTPAVSLSGMDYTTYIGDANQYHVTAITTDGNGNTFVTGSRAVLTLALGASPVTDVFVSRVDSSGDTTLITTLSGKGSDQANGIAVDASGNIYIAGGTSSTDFPLHRPLQSVSGPLQTGFLVKMTADGTVLYSTYFGGTLGYSTLSSVSVDSQGNAYVAGMTFAQDYPHTAGLPAGAVNAAGVEAVSGAFFAKISPGGDKILYAGAVSATGHACGAGSTCFLSTISTSATSIAVDSSGNAYIAGNTYGSGLPTTPGALVTNGIGAFVTKVNPAGTSLVYLTLLGAANYIPGGAFSNSNPGNLVYSIAADAAGNAYISGSTSDPAFPATSSAYQKMLSLTSSLPTGQAPPSDAFIAKLNPSGTAMVWATFLGGTGNDQAKTIAVDLAGNVWASGTTASADFPSSSGFPGGSEFLAELNPSGSALTFAARFPSDTVGTGLGIDSSGVVHAAGDTGIVSTITPGQSFVPRVFGLSNSAGGALAGRLAPGELITIYGSQIGPSTPVSSNVNSSGFLPTTLGGVQVTIDGVAVPLLYVSATQINAVAPLELLSPGSTELQVTVNDTRLPALPLAIDPAIPQVFRNTDGSALAVNDDGTINSAAHPAKVGSLVAIWATGTGVGPYAGADGQVQSSPQVFCGCVVNDVATGKEVATPYDGAAPGLVTGVVQINFQATSPAFDSAGFYYLSVGLKTSDTFSIFVTP